MGEHDSCESGGASSEALAALVLSQLHYDTVAFDLRAIAYQELHGYSQQAESVPRVPFVKDGDSEPSMEGDPNDPNVFVLLTIGHKRLRPRGSMIVCPQSVARKYVAMGVARAMTEQEVEEQAERELHAPTQAVQGADISTGLRTAKGVHCGI